MAIIAPGAHPATGSATQNTTRARSRPNGGACVDLDTHGSAPGAPRAGWDPLVPRCAFQTEAEAAEARRPLSAEERLANALDLERARAVRRERERGEAADLERARLAVEGLSHPQGLAGWTGWDPPQRATKRPKPRRKTPITPRKERR